MNRTSILRFSILRNILWGIAVVLLLNSCKKGDNDYPGNNTGVSYVGLVHASAGATALDFAFDNNRAGVNYFNYTDRINYLNVYPGTRNFNVYNKNAGISNPNFTKSINFIAGKYYTIFLADTASKMDAVVVRDSTRAAIGDSVRLRFSNMSPDAPALDLYVKGNVTPIASNITYKSAGAFFSYPSEGNVVFEIRKNGQSTLLATADAVNLYRGNVYTVWTGGYTGGSDAAGTRIRLEIFSH